MRAAVLYLGSLVSTFALSAALTPLMRKFALRFRILDRPNSSIKTHTEPVPYLGGFAVWLSFMVVLAVLRLITHLPTGTLHALRGIVFGGLLILFVGIVDDLHVRGIGFIVKFIFQFAAAGILIVFDIRIQIVDFYPLSVILTLVWVVGITNAFNIIDVMDGLSSGVAVTSALGFLLVSVTTGELYVGVAALALMGACLGFLPYNLSKRRRIFLGDTGSLFIGFVLSALSLGSSFTTVNRIGYFAPILILFIPIYETVLVSFFRIRRGQSPFLGSKDHFALRMQKLGFSRRLILLIVIVVSLSLSGIAYIITTLQLLSALILYGVVIVFFIFIARWLGKVEID